MSKTDTILVGAVLAFGQSNPRPFPAGWKPKVQTWALCGMLAATLSFACGCDTPYTRRVRQLDEQYQQGKMSREDYMRFVHDAEQWERK